MNQHRRTIAALAAGLVLASCAGVPIVGPAYYAVGYTPGEERVAGVEMPVLVRGNPFAVPQAEFDAEVTDAMQGWPFGLVLHFTPQGNPNAVYRVVMVFNPPAGVGDATYCIRPLPVQAVFGLAPGAARTPVNAVFCRGDGVLASAAGSLSTAGGPQSPDFRAGVGQFTAALFPPRNPENQPDHCSGGSDC
ncbi:MAG: hypothetical protein JO010_11340 [Alphaproteobacteria bacterium]|nr:hypothetical protein [Alphaproteobacteria bacterium]